MKFYGEGMKKYELLKNDTKTINGRTLYRIKALRSFGNIIKGTLGGYIEKESNLSHDDNAWVYGGADVSGDAKVYGNARVSDNAWVYGNAKVYGDAEVYEFSRVTRNISKDIKDCKNNTFIPENNLSKILWK